MFGQKEETLRIEGFDTPLRGHRSMVLGTVEDALEVFHSVESESLYRGKNILVLQEGMQNANLPFVLWRKRWDVMFRIKEPFDAQLLATYVANAGKPVRILWISTGHGDIPRSLWSKWIRQDVTLIGSSLEPHTNCVGGCEWETIFFPIQCAQGTVERVLSSRGSGMASLVAQVREYLPEIAASGAALVWTNVEEKDLRGSLYWYDPEKKEKAISFTKAEASQLLEAVSKWVITC
jgi:hypothetical protein